ncbi:MAG: oxidoreductase [Bacteroidetes bacterium CG23_combo_of_CG06-09_8_20_14_all_32_9]|nr:MAG: oxidoreductase [Bacteroidetes bacterium CG23_combo_of_CG06-09_8_20_14_all_32_9]
MITNPKNFSLIGVAGYIAVRHVNAIKETGNRLVATLDKFDSVGFLDNYFPKADFFTEFERFDRHTEKLRRAGTKIDYVSICSPNYLHDSHIRFALRSNSDAICEKPLVLNPWNIDALSEIEKETGHKVNTILQLRLHPSIIALKKQIDGAPANKIYDVDLTYITSRGNWYDFSWKGDVHKSGGIATNIGIHFFDILTWIFGSVKENKLHVSQQNKTAGFLQLEKARVRWFLSLDYNDIPAEVKEKNQRTYRSIKVEGKEIEFSGGFANLHTLSYKSILKNRGFGLEDARTSVETVHHIRNATPIGLIGDFHPMCNNI